MGAVKRDYLNRAAVNNRNEYRKRMTDQEYRNKLALKALDFIRATARVLTEEIEKGYPVSEAVLDDVCEWHDVAVGIAGDPELHDFFEKKESWL